MVGAFCSPTKAESAKTLIPSANISADTPTVESFLISVTAPRAEAVSATAFVALTLRIFNELAGFCVNVCHAFVEWMGLRYWASAPVKNLAGNS